MLSRKRILTVVGARPQFIKAAALSPALSGTGRFTECLLHTGQHFDAGMSDVFFRELGIPAPSVNLGIGGGSHGENTGRMIEALERVMVAERPDAVVVFGDTDSTLAAAISASKLGIVLAHVEAGLRSFRRAMPEEINRVVTDHVADVLYAPSAAAVGHLRREGIPDGRIVRCGDVMFDVVRRFAQEANERSTILSRLAIARGEYQLLTLHRQENTEDREALGRILAGVAQSPVPVIFPMHPRTRKTLAAFGLTLPSIIREVAPLGYLDMIQLLANARLVLTDSGGLQKEAYFVGRPCVTLRDETEWTELVGIGANVLVGSDTALISSTVRGDAWTVSDEPLYGRGNAAQEIAADLVMRIAS